MRRFILALLPMVVLSAALVTEQAGAATRPAVSPAEEEAPGWLVNAQGVVQPVGGAEHFGDLTGYALNNSIVGIGPTPFGSGYWLLAADGGLFAFGDAGFYGSMGGIALASPVVALASTATGEGYWMTAADGGIFAFGDAKFLGSMGGVKLNSPIVAITTTPSGNGYWLVAADGGIFAFGDAEFFGSMGQTTLNSPVVGIAPAPEGDGYWLVGADGGIFSFGSSEFFGSTALDGIEVSGLAPTPSGNGYQVFSKDGRIFGFGSAPSNSKKSDVGSVMGVAPRPNRKRGDRDRNRDGRDGGESGVTSTTRPRTTTTRVRRPRPTTTTTSTTVPSTTTTAAPTTTTAAYPTDINDATLEAERDAVALAACRSARDVTVGSSADKQAACAAASSAAWAAMKAEQQAIINNGGVTTTTTAGSSTTAAPTTTTAAPTTTTAAPTTTTAATTTTAVSTTTSGGSTSMTYPSAGSSPGERAYNALGFYKGGTKASTLRAHEAWMGRDAKYWLVWLGGTFNASLNAIRSGVGNSDSRYLQDERTLILSMNLTEREGHSGSQDATQQLTDAKNGANDWYWQELGRVLTDKGLDGYWPDGRPKVILRIAWEHNGNWYPWSSRPGRNDLFRQAYRRAVLQLETTVGEVTTVWSSSTLQNTAADLNASYPGDDVVDIIEVDVYDAYGAYLPNNSTSPNVSKRAATWDRKLNGSSGGLTGLQFFADFARDHNKGFAIGEFGSYSHVKNGSEVGGGDNPAFIQNIFDFVGAQENLVYVNYFETDRPGVNGTKHRLSGSGYPGGNGSIQGSQFPLAAAKFLELWGN